MKRLLILGLVLVLVLSLPGGRLRGYDTTTTPRRPRPSPRRLRRHGHHRRSGDTRTSGVRCAGTGHVQAGSTFLETEWAVGTSSTSATT